MAKNQIAIQNANFEARSFHDRETAKMLTRTKCMALLLSCVILHGFGRITFKNHYKGLRRHYITDPFPHSYQYTSVSWTLLFFKFCVNDSQEHADQCAARISFVPLLTVVLVHSPWSTSKGFFIMKRYRRRAPQDLSEMLLEIHVAISQNWGPALYLEITCTRKNNVKAPLFVNLSFITV